MTARLVLFLSVVVVALLACFGLYKYGYTQGQANERLVWLETQSIKAKEHQEAMAKLQKNQSALIDRANSIEQERGLEIESLNNRVVVLLGQLRERKERGAAANGSAVPPATSPTQPEQSCNGTQLYREDAEFLAREAARADGAVIALNQCYAQYEAVAKSLQPVASMAD